ncbi:hypothetical protein FVEG_01707 [Fusarium verticillioides 7600]|uniref:Uncharacterized protein n=1 Tax=Gibberella moniliformis (strain M3125 / FGSC 7600) TaxID=334819 RepID=W7LGF9_GIBM7|nr:hypothetical protein FVEG_01707 [Fusarium verticillioides 7600]EWG38508.1 hypothetical protein FVEG_01707 [Fusarium verticillioides 7600]
MDKYYASFEEPKEYQNMFAYSSRDFFSQNPGSYLIPYHKGLFALSSQRNEQGMQVVAYREEKLTILALLGAIGFAVDQESPTSDALKRRKIMSSPQSKDALEFMQKWMLEYNPSMDINTYPSYC